MVRLGLSQEIMIFPLLYTGSHTLCGSHKDSAILKLIKLIDLFLRVFSKSGVSCKPLLMLLITLMMAPFSYLAKPEFDNLQFTSFKGPLNLMSEQCFKAAHDRQISLQATVQTLLV